MSRYKCNSSNPLLDKRSYGLDREFSRLCPNFEITEIKELIERYLDDAKNYV